jgi:hypothetical protein
MIEDLKKKQEETHKALEELKEVSQLKEELWTSDLNILREEINKLQKNETERISQIELNIIKHGNSETTMKKVNHYGEIRAMEFNTGKDNRVEIKSLQPTEGKTSDRVIRKPQQVGSSIGLQSVEDWT